MPLRKKDPPSTKSQSLVSNYAVELKEKCWTCLSGTSDRRNPGDFEGEGMLYSGFHVGESNENVARATTSFQTQHEGHKLPYLSFLNADNNDKPVTVRGKLEYILTF